jgi:hypothetical protein
MMDPDSSANTGEMIPFTEAEVQWIPSIAGATIFTEAAVASSLVNWSKKLEVNILTRARVPQQSHKKYLGRCRPAIFREKQLFKKTSDNLGAAQSKWSRLWARINSALVEWKTLVLKPPSRSRSKHLRDSQKDANKLSKKLHEFNSASGQPEGIHVKFAVWLLDLASWTSQQVIKRIEVSEKSIGPRPEAFKSNVTRGLQNGSKNNALKA